ncbi:hypothetical protein EDC40_11624 [Aminobacter aminovorans]|jgi:hypothetical protein|uniref:Uncharacterized protein n=2 Tax=Aminobacter aminovorans TaxID=83263 RepID=A0A380WFT8_AMIAI|nr:hypothetical protein EDC40_11624 [Aminobacter aminovorans]SUU87761.1 Uncharacterised protein [Aminobacter aminovorans]
MTMSTDVLKATYVQPARLQPVFDWFRQMRAALNVPTPQDATELSEHYRRDTGIAKKDIARAVDAELGHLGLLDIGWQQPRRQNRR